MSSSIIFVVEAMLKGVRLWCQQRLRQARQTSDCVAARGLSLTAWMPCNPLDGRRAASKLRFPHGDMAWWRRLLEIFVLAFNSTLVTVKTLRGESPQHHVTDCTTSDRSS